MDHFVKQVLNKGGIIKPLVIDSSLTNGTAIFNPSIFVDNNQLYCVIRHCQYTLYHSDLNVHEHMYGPLVYLNPENDITLTTTNYFCELDSELNIRKTHKIDTSLMDVPPIWEFVGLEDARLVKWNDKFYISGVRRDTTPNGQGRMELSEIEIKEDGVREISRFRIPAPGADNTYCEKNWMPILDMPYHYIKWSNPVEVVKADPDKKTCETVYLDNRMFFAADLRGGGQVIPFDDGYLSVHHETFLYRTETDRKNATYRHRFVMWNKDWTPRRCSPLFTYLNAKIEFTCGLANYHDDVLVSFGFQDNAAYLLKCPKSFVREFLYAE